MESIRLGQMKGNPEKSEIDQEMNVRLSYSLEKCFLESPIRVKGFEV